MKIELTRMESQVVRVALETCARRAAEEARYVRGDARRGKVLYAAAESYSDLSRIFLRAELDEVAARGGDGDESAGPSGVTGDNLEEAGA